MAAGLDEDDIKKVVHAFYAKVRLDPLLAPIFATKIKGEDWPNHLDHIINFWSSIFLKTGRFDGNPMRKNLALDGLTPAHFTRWLSLFKETTDTVLTAEKSHIMHAMAQRIAQSLQMGLAFNFEKSGNCHHPFVAFGIRPSKETA